MRADRPGSRLLLGAHMSIAGGLHKAFERGEDLGCTAIQIFTKNASQWRAPQIPKQEVTMFLQERVRTGIQVIAHDAYLINMCSSNHGLYTRSKAAFMDEMERAELLEIPYLVMHPGAHTGAGEDAGMEALVRAFNDLLRDSGGFRVQILLENTAGQGTALGNRFEQLGRVIREVGQPERMGVCLDTCHAFAAGYDLRDSDVYQEVLAHFDKVVGLEWVKAWHVNDSKKGLGSRVDRHEHIGLGMLGVKCFKLVMNDPRFTHVPKILETPKLLDGIDMDPVNLALLRGLVARSGRE